MSKTVLSNPGAIGMSIASVTDVYKKIAAIMVLGERLVGGKTSDASISDALIEEGLEPSAENIAKVRAFFS